MSATATAVRPIACPRCGAEVRGDQSWCTECGLAARTRLAPPPDWRLPTLVAGGIGLAAIVALLVAFVVLTRHNAPVTPATPTPAAATAAPDTTAPATTPPPAATTAPAPAATAPPAATTPPATTTTP